MIDAVNAFAWGSPILGIPGVTGVLLALGVVFMPWRKVGYGFRLLSDNSAAVGEGEVKPFNALMTALSATVGTVLLVTMGAHSAAAQADDATYEPGRVRDAVLAATGGREEPFWYGSLSRQELHLAQAPEPVSTAAQVTAEQLAAERRFRASVKASEDPADIRAYLEQFPGGMFEALARNRIERPEAAAQPRARQVAAAPTSPTQEAAPAPSPSPKSVEEALGLTRAQRVLVQRGLTALGFEVGAADGIFGARTRAGIGKWQSSRGEGATGYLDAGAFETLLEAGEAVPPAPQRQAAGEAMELLSEALSIARSIVNERSRAEVLGAIAGAQASAGDTRGAQRTVSEALPIARSIEYECSRAEALGAIAKAQAIVGDTRGAQRTVSEALRSARSEEYPVDRARALGAVAEAQAHTGDTRGAARIVSEALRSARGVEDARNLGAIAKAMASVGDMRGAALTVSEALRSARSVDSKPFRAWHLAAVAQAQAHTGDTRGAARTVSEALSVFRSLDENDRGWAVEEIAEVQAILGDIQGALSTLGRFNTISRARVLAAFVQSRFGRTQEWRDDEPVATPTSRPSSTQARPQAQQAVETQSAKKYWGAYAEAGSYADDTQGYGVSWNYSSPKQAIDRAIEECTKRHTYDDCLEYIMVFSTSSKRHGDYDDRYTVSGYDKVRIFRHRCVGVVKDGPDIVAIFGNSESEAADPSNALHSVNSDADLVQVECNHR